jgi:hypothetical protein
MSKPKMVAVELSRQEIETLAKDHIHHGDENLSLGKMVEEEGLSSREFKRFSILRYKRAAILMGVADTMEYCENVPE